MVGKLPESRGLILLICEVEQPDADDKLIVRVFRVNNLEVLASSIEDTLNLIPDVSTELEALIEDSHVRWIGVD